MPKRYSKQFQNGYFGTLNSQLTMKQITFRMSTIHSENTTPNHSLMPETTKNITREEPEKKTWQMVCLSTGDTEY
jgi:hypothetical protein